MQEVNQIRYLPNNEINKVLWDECIDNAGNGLIYAYSYYLDQMAGDWDALVLNNYEAVMPLPWRKKFGVYYLYQPFLSAQLGLFGNGLTAAMLSDFLHTIPARFRLWEFSLNHGNVFELPSFPVYGRMNYVLVLSPSYDTLKKNFRENIRRNIKKSVSYELVVDNDVPIEKIIELAGNQSSDHRDDLGRFSKLYQLLRSRKQAKAYGVLSRQNELLASAVFLFSHKRAYYILVSNHPNGRTLGASHALVNAFIEDHAGTDLLLDFEGSDIRNLAFFYSSFGAKEENYLAIKMNRLPWYMKLLKK